MICHQERVIYDFPNDSTTVCPRRRLESRKLQAAVGLANNEMNIKEFDILNSRSNK